MPPNRPRRAKRQVSSRDRTTADAVPRALPPIRWRALLVILFVTVAAFIPAVRAPFQFDDVTAIARNASIRRLWPPSVPLNPPAATAVSGRPIVNYSLALNYRLNAALGVDQRADPDGPNKTVGYHVANILIHLLTGLLLLGIVRRTLYFGRVPEFWSSAPSWTAPAIVLVWLVHPIQTEAVDYVVQRTELLVSAFYLAALYASIRAWDAGHRRARVCWYVAGFVACLLGVWSKEVMVTAPLMVILYDRAFRAASWREMLSERVGRRWFYLALFLTWIPLSVSIAGNARAATVGFSHGVTWYEYLYTQGWAVSRYLRLMFWPSSLTYDYGARPVLGLAPLPGTVVLAGLLVATVVVWRRAPWVGFLGAWFFLLLAPSSSIVPIHTEIAAERRVYLAFAAIPALLLVGGAALRRRFAQQLNSRAATTAATVLGVAIVLALSGLTAARSRLYTDPEALWRDAIAKRPANARAYDNLAAVLVAARSPRVPEAEQLWRQAIDIDSTYITAYTNLADLEVEREHFTGAYALLERAVRINPDAVLASQALGGVLVKLGDPQRAITLLERSTAVIPTDDALATLAMAYIAVGRLDDAVGALRRSIALNPRRMDLMAYLGALLTNQERFDEAVEYLESAARDPSASDATLAALSFVDAQLGRADASVAAARAVIARGEASPEIWLRLGQAMQTIQRLDDAGQLFARAVAGDPTNLEAITRLGIIHAASGRPADAERLFRRALAIQPDYVPARRSLEKLLATPP